MPSVGEAVAFQTQTGAFQLRSITGGPTGRISATPARALPGRLIGMDWVNAHDGWIWSTSHVWKTSNEGRTWQALGRLPGWPRNPGMTVYMTSQAQGYAAVGQNGLGNGPSWEATKLFHTDTGGRTWTRVTLPTITYPLPNGTPLRLGGIYVAGVRAYDHIVVWTYRVRWRSASTDLVRQQRQDVASGPA